MLEGIRFTDRCELPYGYLELNPGRLKGQPVLLSAESSVQPLKTIFKMANHLLVHFFKVFLLLLNQQNFCVCVRQCWNLKVKARADNYPSPLWTC